MDLNRERPSEEILGYCTQVAEIVHGGVIDLRDDPVDTVIAGLSGAERIAMIFDAYEADHELPGDFVEILPAPGNPDEKIPIRDIVKQLAYELVYREAVSDPAIWEFYNRKYTEDW